MLICAVLGRYVNEMLSVFYNLHVISKSPAEMSMPIGAVLRSPANCV